MIWVVGGTCEYRRNREWLRLKKHLESTGQQITTTDAGADVFGQDPWLVVWGAESRKDLDKLLDRNCVLIYAGKKPEKASWLAGIDRKCQVWHDAPTPWEAVALAQEFLISEGSKVGLDISKPLAGQIVARSGTDLALLSREVQKLGYAGLDSWEQLITGWGAVPIDDLMMALGKQDAQAIVRVLPRFGKGSSGAIMVSRLIASQMLTWLGAAEMEARDCSSDLIAEAVGVHPYRYRVGMQETIRKLGYRKIRGLVHHLARVEQAVQSGEIDPWNNLLAGILIWCRGF